MSGCAIGFRSSRPGLPSLAAAPMEGLTTRIWRRLHAERFGGADAYYVPFATPTAHGKFTTRQLKELAPEVNAGLPVVPQLMTADARNFLWAARALADMGYPEVNLNLGCPSGTVDARGRGAGFLRDIDGMRGFFLEVFSQSLPIAVTVKTRLGWNDPEEFEGLISLYSQFPLSGLIVHLRTRSDKYRGDVREDVFAKAFGRIPFPCGYNGDLVFCSDLERVHRDYPQISMCMVGRALMADPALFRKARGGAGATREEIFSFSRELFARCAADYRSWNNALERMKEYWQWQRCLFAPEPELETALFRAKNARAFEEAMAVYEARARILPEPRTVWRKP